MLLLRSVAVHPVLPLRDPPKAITAWPPLPGTTASTLPRPQRARCVQSGDTGRGGARLGYLRGSMLSEEAGGEKKIKHGGKTVSSPKEPHVPTESLAGHAKGGGGKTAGCGQQPCCWSLDLFEAVARPHPSFHLYSQPNSWDPCWCHWRGPHIPNSASSVFLPFVHIPHGPESSGWDRGFCLQSVSLNLVLDVFT